MNATVDEFVTGEFWYVHIMVRKIARVLHAKNNNCLMTKRVFFDCPVIWYPYALQYAYSQPSKTGKPTILI